jgi:hypothetical protein|tara:strand:+ start:7210 stop:7317 length:108 start_codon:yes stop_codon:yes gene_type:complete
MNSKIKPTEKDKKKAFLKTDVFLKNAAKYIPVRKK